MGLASVRFSRDLLDRMLHLPDDATIRTIDLTRSGPNDIVIVIESDEITEDGEYAPAITRDYDLRDDDPAAYTWRWGDRIRSTS